MHGFWLFLLLLLLNSLLNNDIIPLGPLISDWFLHLVLVGPLRQVGGYFLIYLAPYGYQIFFQSHLLLLVLLSDLKVHCRITFFDHLGIYHFHAIFGQNDGKRDILIVAGAISVYVYVQNVILLLLKFLH